MGRAAAAVLLAMIVRQIPVFPEAAGVSVVRQAVAQAFSVRRKGRDDVRMSGHAKGEQQPGEQRRLDEPFLDLSLAFLALPDAFAGVGFEIYPAQGPGFGAFKHHQRLRKQRGAVAKGVRISWAGGGGILGAPVESQQGLDISPRHPRTNAAAADGQDIGQGLAARTLAVGGGFGTENRRRMRLGERRRVDAVEIPGIPAQIGVGALLRILAPAPVAGAEGFPVAGAQGGVGQDKAELASRLQVVINAGGDESGGEVVLRGEVGAGPQAAFRGVPAEGILPPRSVFAVRIRRPAAALGAGIVHVVIDHPGRVAHHPEHGQAGQAQGLHQVGDVPFPYIVAPVGDILAEAAIDGDNRLPVGGVGQVQQREQVGFGVGRFRAVGVVKQTAQHLGKPFLQEQAAGQSDGVVRGIGGYFHHRAEL